MQRALDSAIGLPRRSTSVVDARVGDASGREKKPHGYSFARGVGVVLPSERLSRAAQIIVRSSRRGTFPNTGPSRGPSSLRIPDPPGRIRRTESAATDEIGAAVQS